MHFKLLIALVEEDKTQQVLEAARDAGATGSTVISNVRGEGLVQRKSFLGMNLESQRDYCMFLVEEHLSRSILERIAEVGDFDASPGNGIAFQIDVEDAVGVAHQVEKLTTVVEDEL